MGAGLGVKFDDREDAGGNYHHDLGKKRGRPPFGVGRRDSIPFSTTLSWMVSRITLFQAWVCSPEEEQGPCFARAQVVQAPTRMGN